MIDKIKITWECIKDALKDKRVLKAMLLDFLKGVFLFFISYLTIISIITMENGAISLGLVTFLLFIGMIYLYNNVIKIFWRKW